MTANITAAKVEDLVIRRTLRVPTPSGPEGNSAPIVRQFDAALMSVGFKLSDELFTRLCGYSEGTVIDTAVSVLAVARQMVGDHIEHNVYFRDFPRNVPDTVEFWTECVLEALADHKAAAHVYGDVLFGTLNLLSLPKYGRYQHSHTDMLAAHAEFIDGADDRVTVLHAGDSLAEEATALYHRLAASTTPLSDDDREALQMLADTCVGDEKQPTRIPIRENRALINRVRLNDGRDLLIDSPTDVLRLACALSDGDVTLQERTRFRSLPRRHRRALLAALDRMIADNPAKLGDVGAYAEQWKRLGERLHPNEHPEHGSARRVFAVARGEERVPSLTGRVEAALASGNVVLATAILSAAPGMLYRSLDRLLQLARTKTEIEAVVDAAFVVAESVSGRVILSVREHLRNRLSESSAPRVFANRRGRAWVTSDDRPPLDDEVVGKLIAVLDAEIARRLPDVEHLAVDADLLDVALPLSDKAMPPGFGLLPRGSRTSVQGDLLRFFCYWKEASQRTDFDLSALMIDDQGYAAHLSWTSLTAVGGAHSGDITSAPNGASEFIDLELSKVRARYIIPQVNVYSGEGFNEVEESFFGYMLRDREQEGKPFEPRTVRMKSDLRGENRVALPMAFVREDGGWSARWLHLFLRGQPSFNRVEGNRLSTLQLVEGIAGREYVTVRDLVGWLAPARLSIVERGGVAPTGVTLRLTVDDLDGVKNLIPA